MYQRYEITYTTLLLNVHIITTMLVVSLVLVVYLFVLQGGETAFTSVRSPDQPLDFIKEAVRNQKNV